MKLKRRYFLALSLASIGAISAFASVSAASIQAGTPNRVRDEVRTAIKQAFNTNDYQGYLATTKDYKIGVPILTEVQFHAMVEAQRLRVSGDKEGAKKLLESAGLKPDAGKYKTSHKHVKTEKNTVKAVTPPQAG